MMYNNKFVMAIKVGGKVLREEQDVVALPFGAEYELYFKNLNTRRAAVKVEIDGKDVLGGNMLVVEPNGDYLLERHITSLYEGQRFKFIERTTRIEQQGRGIGAEDGIIRVTFRYEQSAPVRPPINSLLTRGREQLGSLGGSFEDLIGDNTRSMDVGDWGSRSMSKSCAPLQSPGVPYHESDSTEVLCSASGTTLSAEVSRGQAAEAQIQTNVAGFTAEGSTSSQQFSRVSMRPLDAEEHVMVLKLVGRVGEQTVVQPVTIKTKKHCSSCGEDFDFKYQSCPYDGTHLRVA